MTRPRKVDVDAAPGARIVTPAGGSGMTLSFAPAKLMVAGREI